MNERFLKPYRVVEKRRDGKTIFLVVSRDDLVRSSALDKEDAEYVAVKYNQEGGVL